MKLGNVGLIATAAVLVIGLVSAASAENISVVRHSTELAPTQNQASGGERDEYFGTLKVFMVETASRWRDNNNYQYDNGWLDYAIDKGISVPDGQVYSQIVVWNSAASGYGDLSPNNYGAVAAVFNSHGVVEYAYPPATTPFTAYDVDAAAEAHPGQPGLSSLDGGYTHTVLVEEGTAEW